MKILGMLFILVVGGGLVWWGQSSNKSDGGNSVAITPGPTGASVAGPTGTEVYTNTDLGYSIRIPDGFNVQNPGGDYSVHFVPGVQEPSSGPANFIYTSVVPGSMIQSEGEIYNYNPADYEKLMELEIGESVSLADTNQPDLNEWFMYTRVDDVEIDGATAKRFENNEPWEFPAGTTETRYIFEKNGTIYILGMYTGGEGLTASAVDPRVAHSAILSFITSN